MVCKINKMINLNSRMNITVSKNKTKEGKKLWVILKTLDFSMINIHNNSILNNITKIDSILWTFFKMMKVLKKLLETTPDF